MSPPRITEQVGTLVAAALAVHARGPAEPALRAVADRLSQPLRVAIAGRVKAGKSTLLNALVGQQLAATDAGECTRIVTWYVDGLTYRITLHPRGGPPRQLPFRRLHGALDIALDGVATEDVERLVVDWPAPVLREMTLIDTPGMGSTSTEVGLRTEALLTPGGADDAEDGPGDVDAVVYLIRHVHGEDVRFLEAFQDGSVDRRPINTVGVLARADEVGHAKPDALGVAARVAERYAADQRIRALCRTVVPVAGLLAASAAGLRETEYRAIELLAASPDVDRLLVTADRLLAGAPELDLLADERAALLDRFGMFGLRLAVRLIRDRHVASATDLARELLTASGLPALRTILSDQFAGRADVLKARSALMGLEAILRRHPLPAAAGLLHEAERVRAGAHEFAEIVLVDRLRSGAVPLAEEELHEAELLLGVTGADARSRLRLTADVGPDTVRKAAAEQHLRWQRRAEHPATSREVGQAARVLVRTCEGILGEFAAG